MSRVTDSSVPAIHNNDTNEITKCLLCLRSYHHLLLLGIWLLVVGILRLLISTIPIATFRLPVRRTNKGNIFTYFFYRPNNARIHIAIVHEDTVVYGSCFQCAWNVVVELPLSRDRFETSHDHAPYSVVSTNSTGISGHFANSYRKIQALSSLLQLKLHPSIGRGW